ncbi:MAG: hypothetical protein J6K05_05130 [Bacteroidaceae bacterium]|nr:hypothetical protein [Bacteroidaceae bacterium]
MEKTHRVAYNTVALYANMVVTMLVTLLGTRFVLEALGKQEYALYTLLMSTVLMLSFINVAMANATQRYLSFSMGANDKAQVREIFYNSTVIHSLIALLLGILLLGLGIPAVHYWLDIPYELRDKAVIVLLCMITSVVCTVLSVPFEATMNAHEDIFVIAGISALEAVCKLAAAVIVLNISQHQLIIYSVLMMSASMIAFLCKRMYSRSHYEESHYVWHKVKDFQLIRNMIGFAGWNLIGIGCSMVRYQGAAILLNKFFGLLINAGYGVAQQVNSFLLFFANSAVRPMRPYIVKSEGAGEHGRMIKLSDSTSRVVSLMLAMVIVPLYINMPLVLEVWLAEVPYGALEFCRGFLLVVLIGQLSIGLQIALESVGRIKRLHLIVGTMHILPIPAAYICFKCGLPYYYMIYCLVAEEVLCLFFRAYITWKDAEYPMKPFVFGHILPCVASIVVSYVVSAYLATLCGNAWIQLLVSTVSNTAILGVCSYFFCLTVWEKDKLYSLVSSIASKIRKR